jgi:hypothetical protein
LLPQKANDDRISSQGGRTIVGLGFNVAHGSPTCDRPGLLEVVAEVILDVTRDRLPDQKQSDARGEQCERGRENAALTVKRAWFAGVARITTSRGRSCPVLVSLIGWPTRRD